MKIQIIIYSRKTISSKKIGNNFLKFWDTKFLKETGWFSFKNANQILSILSKFLMLKITYDIYF